MKIKKTLPPSPRPASPPPPGLRRESAQQRQARLDREAAARHALFLRTLDRIDRERDGRPHRPALVNDFLHADAVTAAADRAAPVAQPIAAPPGPRTGTHPQATRRVRRPMPEAPPAPEPPPMATRTRPAALQDCPPRGPRPALPPVALSAALILAAVAGALWLAR